MEGGSQFFENIYKRIKTEAYPQLEAYQALDLGKYRCGTCQFPVWEVPTCNHMCTCQFGPIVPWCGNSWCKPKNKCADCGVFCMPCCLKKCSACDKHVCGQDNTYIECYFHLCKTKSVPQFCRQHCREYHQNVHIAAKDTIDHTIDTITLVCPDCFDRWTKAVAKYKDTCCYTTIGSIMVGEQDLEVCATCGTKVDI